MKAQQILPAGCTPINKDLLKKVSTIVCAANDLMKVQKDLIDVRPSSNPNRCYKMLFVADEHYYELRDSLKSIGFLREEHDAS